MRVWLSKMRAMLAGRGGLADELREEIDAHLESEVQEDLARGMPLEEARNAARRRFGNVGLIRENAHQRVAIRQIGNPSQGLGICSAFAGQESRVRCRGRCYTGPRHRGQLRDL